MTLLELVEAQSARLEQAGVSFGHGTTNAFDEAAWLTLWALQLPIDALDEHAGRELDPQAPALVEELVTRRIETRQPAAYLTHQAWLQGVPFYVDRRAIVPRSFIAELIASDDYAPGLDAWLPQRLRHVLDLCTGNGSLAVLAALAWPEVHVDASDISSDALAIARINVRKHRLGSRIRLAHGHLFDEARGPYDLILCNPPYVNAASMAGLPAEYRAEPELALAGGADGMDLVRELLWRASSHLNPRGVLVLEIGNERVHFERAFPKLQVVWLETSAGHDQVLATTREALYAVGPPP
jgi:ribosomal protein L3 glutamine methyltransferase